MNLNPKVDAYIAKSAPFAQPILEYIRQLVHDANPEITEEMKWGAPAFMLDGIVCIMAAFKKHCALNFMKAKLMNDPNNILESIEKTAFGTFGKIYSIDDLPSKKVFINFVNQAIKLNKEGVKISKPKSTFEVPKEYIEILKSKDIEAFENFEKMAPSHKKEYALYYIDAKREETKQSRLEKSILLLKENKGLNSKYENC